MSTSDLRVPTFTLCTTPSSVANAIATLSRSEYLVLDCEGKDIGRKDGVLSLLCIGTPRAEHIFIFDALALTFTNASSALGPLLNLLRSDRMLKIVWDGRQDFLELLDCYGVGLCGVVDLQIAEVVSRSGVRGENEKMRLSRLATGYLSYRVVKEKRKELDGMHIVIGMQRCLEQTRLSNYVMKDEEVVAMHKANGSAKWLERPVEPKLLQYAANDIYAIDLLYNYFLQHNWINPVNFPLLLAQSQRYTRTQWQQGRTDDTHPFRMGSLLPLDVLNAPRGTLGGCAGCARMLSLGCFETMRQQGTVRKSRCRLCNVIASKRKLPPDEEWIQVGSGQRV